MTAGNEWVWSDCGGVDGLIRCADTICNVWLDAVVEDTAAGEFAHSVDSLVPTEESELCVYRDLNAARHWQRGGVQSEMSNSMIQINLVPGGVRLIADDWREPALQEVMERLSRSAVPG